MDLTRRSFLAGVGSVTVGLLFARKLDRVLDELEAESLAEVPLVADQAPVAATITCITQQGFRPSRLFVASVPKMVSTPVKRWARCACYQTPDERLCTKCNAQRFALVETGEFETRAVPTSPWIIDDITINGKSQFVGDGGIPGDLFSTTAIDSAINFDSAAPGIEIKFRVRYQGDSPEGEIFHGALLGKSLDGVSHQLVLPINSGVKITRYGARVA